MGHISNLGFLPCEPYSAECVLMGHPVPHAKVFDVSSVFLRSRDFGTAEADESGPSEDPKDGDRMDA